jgi:hypothetical protein
VVIAGARWIPLPADSACTERVPLGPLMPLDSVPYGPGMDPRALVVQAGTRPGRVNEERDAAAKDPAAGCVVGACKRQLVLADAEVGRRHDPAFLEVIRLFEAQGFGVEEA